MNSYIEKLKNQERPTNNHYLNRLIKILYYYANNVPIDCYEKHHILPKNKSWYPEFSKDSNNILKVPIKAHFIIHHLLHKSFPKCPAMYTAFWNMTHLNKSVKLTSKQYSSIRKLHSDNMKINNPSKGFGVMDGIRGELNPAKRPEVREKIRKARLGKVVSDDTKLKQREKMIGRYDGENNPFYGKSHSEKSKEKVRLSRALRKVKKFGFESIDDAIVFFKLCLQENMSICDINKKTPLPYGSGYHMAISRFISGFVKCEGI